MSFESAIRITNASEGVLLLHLEPWGDVIAMPRGATVVVVAEAAEAGAFEVEHAEGSAIVWAWPTAVAKVYCEGDEIADYPNGGRPAVPPVPGGHRAATFLRARFGRDAEG